MVMVHRFFGILINGQCRSSRTRLTRWEHWIFCRFICSAIPLAYSRNYSFDGSRAKSGINTRVVLFVNCNRARITLRTPVRAHVKIIVICRHIFVGSRGRAMTFLHPIFFTPHIFFYHLHFLPGGGRKYRPVKKFGTQIFPYFWKPWAGIRRSRFFNVRPYQHEVRV